MSTPIPLQQLAQRATKGPWEVEDGPDEYSVVNRKHDGDDWCIATVHAGNEANAQLIARCSPETLLAVYAALTQCAKQDIFTPSKCSNASSAAKTALSLLDGQTNPHSA